MELGEYKCSGKKYNGEKAIISLTSWKARINTVSKTLYSLLRNCPGFHIVLVLSEEEFPKMEKELPENLMLFVDGGLIELLWVYKNWKSLKKVLFTIDKYMDVPVISADDDCIYVCNYAQELYELFECNNKNMPIAYRRSSFRYCCCGPATIYPTNIYKQLLDSFKNKKLRNYLQDDNFISDFLKKNKINPIYYSDRFPCYFHDELKPINGSKSNKNWEKSQRFV